MNFDYSEEQQLLADSVRRLLSKDYEFEARRKIVASAEGYSPQVWAKFAEMGLTALPLSPDYGGFGGGAVDLMGVMEAFGEALVVEPLVPTLVGALLVAKGGSAELKQAVLPAVAEGKMKLAFAHTEAGSRYSLSDIKTKANGGKLDGEKRAVVGAPMADKLVVSTQGGALFLVDRADTQIKSLRTLDEMAAGDVSLRSAKAVPLQGGAQLIEEVVDFATALACAEAAGAMKFACDTTLEYLKTRKQFGVPIGTFQALQHRIVDLYVAQEQARSMACLACSKIDSSENAADRIRAVSAAKIKIADNARQVSQEAVQLHGGMGMSEELKISHSFRRLAMLAQQYGDADFHLERFASL
jgi:alkylation response protein AidB-like acyl-CoA dehydrogenase